jgi:hypothetical protein
MLVKCHANGNGTENKYKGYYNGKYLIKAKTSLQVMVMVMGKSMVTVKKRYSWTLQSGGYGGSDSPLGLGGRGGGGGVGIRYNEKGKQRKRSIYQNYIAYYFFFLVSYLTRWDLVLKKSIKGSLIHSFNSLGASYS